MLGTVADRTAFLLEIEWCFTITDRGTVVAGQVSVGVIHTGDAVDLVHGGRAMRARCHGVEMISGRHADGSHLAAIGLLLAGVRKFDALPGDFAATPGSW
jgi:translation elongation factor EF-Tu-like GTPase